MSRAGGVGRAGSELFDFAADLRRAAGGDQLLKDMLASFKVSAKKLTPATRAAALQQLPSRGGLARRVAKAPQRVVARVGGTTASVTVIVAGKKKGSGASGADEGLVRHPVFGRVNAQGRRVFVAQQVRGGWFSRTAEFLAPDVARELDERMDEVGRRAGFR